MYIKYIQPLYQSRLSTVDHAISLVAPAITVVYNLNGRMLDRRQDQVSYISYVGVHLVLLCENLHCVFSRCQENNVFIELYPNNGCCTVSCLHSFYLAVGQFV
jgi:hypothetical protein